MAEAKTTKSKATAKTADTPKTDNRGKHTGVTHKPYENSPIIQDATSDSKNVLYIKYIRELKALPPVDTTNIDALEKRFDDYLTLCEKYNVKPGNLNAYTALGISKTDAYDWENMRASGQNFNTSTKQAVDRSHFIKKVKDICGSFREVLIANGGINPVTGIFWQKNYDGLKDVQDVVLTNDNGDMATKTEAEVIAERKARSALPDA